MGFGKEGAKRRGNQSCALKRPIWGTNKPRQPTQPPMKTRLTLLRATAFAALACGGHAQTVTAPAAPQAPAAPPSLSLTATPTYASQYMFRGQRLSGPSFEPSAEADYGAWALGFWSNFPLAAKVPGQSDPEIDPYGSYTYSLNDSWSIQPGFTLYTYVRAPLDQGFYRMTFEPNLALNYSVGALKLTPKVYYDLVLKGPTYEFNAAWTLPLTAINSEIDFLGTAGTYLLTDFANNTTPKVKLWGDYWLGGASMPFALSKAVKLTVGWAYTKGSGGFSKQGTLPKVVNSEAVARGVATVSLAYTF